MKIVIAAPFYPPESGVLGMYAQGLETALRKHGHEVIVCTYGNLRRLPAGVRHLALFFRIYNVIWQSDFVLALDTWSVGLPALIAASATRTPLIVRIGGDPVWESFVERRREPVRFSEFYAAPRRLSIKERLMRWVARLMVRDAKKLLFNTRFQKDIWQKAYGFDDSRAGILENFVAPKGEPTPAQGQVFVAAGRNIFLKNRDKLDIAFARVRQRFPQAELDTRSLPQTEHLARLASCYAVVIASVSDIGPNMAIDAVTAGKPFVSTEDSGAKERLDGCGLFIDTRTDAAIEAAIVKMLDPAEYQRLLANVQAFSFTHSWDEMADEIVAAATS